jgi:hypothetical protein
VHRAASAKGGAGGRFCMLPCNFLRGGDLRIEQKHSSNSEVNSGYEKWWWLLVGVGGGGGLGLNQEK